MLGEARLNLGLHDFPFESKLNLEPVIRYWQGRIPEDKSQSTLLALEIDKYVKKHPSILTPYTSVEKFLSEHGLVIELLLSGIFPSALSERMLGYASAPFQMIPFYTTVHMQQLLSDPKSSIQFGQYGDFDKIPYSIRACMIILEKQYGVKLDHVLPFLFSLQFEDSGMEMFYNTTSMLDYLEVKTRKKPPELSAEQIHHLLQHTEDTDLWLQTISPDVFYFEGLFIAFMNDVTEVESLSRLRKILLAPGALLDFKTAKLVADLTRIYLHLNKVEVGIAALDYPGEKSVAHRYKIKYPIINHVDRFLSDKNKSSVYETACRLNRTQIISDLQSLEHPAPIEKALIEAGYRSLMVVPLRDQKKKIIGIMELASPEAYTFTNIKKLKLKEILPLYDIALEESRKSVENRIQNVIQNQYTNIHPSVLWKFTETAFNFLEDQERLGEMAVLNPIIFRGVYPLFGQIDIISSTEIRNQAVRSDMEQNLLLLVELLEECHRYFGYPILRKFGFQVKKYLELVQQEFTNNLETAVAELLSQDVNPLLKDLRQSNTQMSQTIGDYFNRLDPQLEIIYDGRKQYQDSLNKVNRTISRYLDKQEQVNQQIIPHYFEKFKTDGVDYSIYVGQSLLQQRLFTNHHLQNLRLWQLKSMVEIYHKLREVRPSLDIDLPVSYLILVYSSTIAIRFRMEEKHFDVEGAYHLQYEVIKNRVDKALVAGTTERLRKKDTLSIVYLQEKDRKEYLEYIGFLVEEGLLKDEIEELNVESLQGIQGLRALRVQFG